MKKILILFASQTGMTADVAANLHDRLSREHADNEYVLMNVRDADVTELPSYPLVIFGCSTWDHGIPAPDGEEFLSRLLAANPDLSSCSYALFGLGDTAYPAFCEALPLIETDLKRCGGKVSSEYFTIDGFANESTMQELVAWSVKHINESSN